MLDSPTRTPTHRTFPPARFCFSPSHSPVAAAVRYVITVTAPPVGTLLRPLGACKSASRRPDQDLPHKSEMAATAVCTICRCHTEASIHHSFAHWTGAADDPSRFFSVDLSFSKGGQAGIAPYFSQEPCSVALPPQTLDHVALAPRDRSSIRSFSPSWTVSLVGLHGRHPPASFPLFSYPGPGNGPQMLLFGRAQGETGQKGLCA